MLPQILKLQKTYLHRPFPRLVSEFRHAMAFYAQFGEDLLDQELLGYDCSDIFCIDVGSFHSISVPNTYMFYQRGGRDICIKLNPAAHSLWRWFLPRDTFIGKGNTGGESCFMTYRTNHSGGETKHILTVNSHSNTAVLRIECINIRKIILDNLQAGQQVDLPSVDCEVMDLDIIRSFPFDVVWPRIMIIEDSDYSEHSEISLLMKRNNYEIASYAKISKIFIDTQVSR